MPKYLDIISRSDADELYYAIYVNASGITFSYNTGSGVAQSVIVPGGTCDALPHTLVLSINGTTGSVAIDGTVQYFTLTGQVIDCDSGFGNCSTILAEAFSGIIYRAWLYNSSVYAGPYRIIPDPLKLDVLAFGSNDQAIAPVNGVYEFTGTSGIQATHFVAVQQAFSVAMTIEEKLGAYGYLFSKSDGSGSRYYSLYSASSNITFFYYRTIGSASITNVWWPVNLADGDVHAVLLAVSDQYVTLTVDGINRGHFQLGGAIDDCPAPSADCQLNIGKRAALNQDGVFYFQGLISDARVYFDRALTSYPSL